MLSDEILLGFDQNGKEVKIEPTHLVCTGITNKAGKTTLLEGLASRGGENQKFLVFRTKPEEAVFKEGHFVKPYLAEQVDWRYYKQLLESSEKMRLKFETWHIMQAAKNIKSLGGFYENCVEKAKSSKREMDRQIFEVLAEYTRTLLDELKDVVFTREFPELKAGINLMDLSDVQDEDIQSIIIRSTLDYVLHHLRNIIVIIPELWKFSPEKRNNPVKEALEGLVRQGATKKNFVWMDSQDMAGTDKKPLKQCYTWILGLQTEKNEAKHTLDQINVPAKSKPKPDEITSLGLGQFFLSTPKGSTKFYALPAWLNDKKDVAIKVATGKMDPETAFAKYGPKSKEEEQLTTNPLLVQALKEEKQRAAAAEEDARQARENLLALQAMLEKQQKIELEKAQEKTQTVEAAAQSAVNLSKWQDPEVTTRPDLPDKAGTVQATKSSAPASSAPIISSGKKAVGTIAFEDDEVDIVVDTNFQPVNFKTSDAQGKFMYSLAVELKALNGKWAGYTEHKEAIREHAGWVMDDSTYTNVKKKLREQNYIKDDSSHTKVRLPLKMHGLIIDGEKVI